MDHLVESMFTTTAGAVAIVEPTVLHHTLRYLGVHLVVPVGAAATVDFTISHHSLRHLGVHLGVPAGAVAAV